MEKYQNLLVIGVAVVTMLGATTATARAGFRAGAAVVILGWGAMGVLLVDSALWTMPIVVAALIVVAVVRGTGRRADATRKD